MFLGAPRCCHSRLFLRFLSWLCTNLRVLRGSTRLSKIEKSRCDPIVVAPLFGQIITAVAAVPSRFPSLI